MEVTNLEQSKVLAEILPIESADMYYWCGEYLRIVEHKAIDKDYDIPCWSLGALLKVIPKHIKTVNTLRIDIDEKGFSIWYDEVGCGVNTKLPDITMENPINACVGIILKLHELNLL